MIEYDMYLYEKQLYSLNKFHICGVDEAGRGPLAGPVFAAAVILEPHHTFTHVRDSKQLSQKKRELALVEIKAHALAISIAIGSIEDIDRINIYRATRETMERAIEGLKVKPDFILTDAMPLNAYKNCESIIKGDQKSISIAAASIVAKTARDMYMIEMSALFPQYGFDQHKGYGTEKHLKALETYGPSPIHRRSFEPIKSMIIYKKK